MIFKVKRLEKYKFITRIKNFKHANNAKKKFLIEIVFLFLSIKGRINFLQLERYGTYTDRAFKLNFEHKMDFMEFNKDIILSEGGGKYAIAFDPSYISQSGKKTPGIGRFWSGCVGAAKLGLKIGAIGAIDIVNNTGFHLEAVQTPNSGSLKEK